jgi:hypothetical protein
MLQETGTEATSKQGVGSSQRRERSERWQVVGVGPHDKPRKAKKGHGEREGRRAPLALTVAPCTSVVHPGNSMTNEALMRS